MTTYHAVFLPILTVTDGKVAIDFADSYSHTDVGDHVTDYDDPSGACALVDEILGEGTTAVERLRRLADFIERQQRD